MVVVSNTRGDAVTDPRVQEVEWRAASGELHVRLADDGPPSGSRQVFHARVVIDLDAHSEVLDVDVMDLPLPVLGHLSCFATSTVTEDSTSGISVDADAAWLWLHVRKGRRADQRRGAALVHITCDDGTLSAIDLTLLGAAGGTAEVRN